MATIAARKTYNPCVNFIALSIDYNTSNIGTANMVQVGTLPAGCVLLNSVVSIVTVFNAATTNVLIVGTAADDDAYVASGDVDPGTLGGTLVPRSAGVYIAADTPVYVKFTETGTAASTGTAKVVVTFIPFVA